MKELVSRNLATEFPPTGRRPKDLTDVLAGIKEAKKYPVAIDFIQKVISDQVGGKLPQELLGEEELKWQLICAELNSTPILFLGTKEGGPASLDNAVSAIEIWRRAEDGEFTPLAVRHSRISIDSKGNKRILAATYQADTSELDAIACSASSLELGKACEEDYENSSLRRAAHPIPSRGLLYLIPGIITDAMVAKTSDDSGQTHNWAIKACKFATRLEIADRGEDSAALGFSVKNLKDTCAITYSPLNAEGWRVEFPKQLQKTPLKAAAASF
ncbi:hypothetical protein C4559_05165 [Candidatus Microgenomates bacterium]|nr:MAG: hypothetical protein C4559_05165 [Candidatus Microgenomates bacterium]